MESNELDRFVRDIVTDKDLPGVDDEIREQLVKDLKERLLDQVDRAIIDAIPEDRIDDFNALLDNEDTTNEGIRGFVSQCGVDVQKVTTNTMLRFRDLYLTPADQREA